MNDSINRLRTRLLEMLFKSKQRPSQGPQTLKHKEHLTLHNLLDRDTFLFKIVNWLQCQMSYAHPFFLSFFFFFFFLWQHSWHMEVFRLGVLSELQLLAFTTATATLDPSSICHLCSTCGNAGHLTHRARSGIEPTSSHIPCQVLNWLSHKGNS